MHPSAQLWKTPSGWLQAAIRTPRVGGFNFQISFIRRRQSSV